MAWVPDSASMTCSGVVSMPAAARRRDSTWRRPGWPRGVAYSVSARESALARARNARRMPASYIQALGSQPQPGRSASSAASSDCRDTHSGSISRSSRGPISVSASGATGPAT